MKRDPQASDPAPRLAPESASPPGGPAVPEIFVRCPLCRAAVAITARQEGRVVQCPDCHSEFTAVRKSAPPARSTPANAAAAEQDDVKLSEPVATPRYVPSAAEGVKFQELYGDDESSPSVSAAPAASRPAIAVEQIAVVCPLCSSRIDTTRDQVGRRIRCGDCHSEFLVTAPRELPRSRKAVPLEPAADEDEFRLSEAPPRPKYQPLTRGEITRAELDALESAERAGHSENSGPSETSVPEAPRSQPERPAFDFEVVCRHCGSRIPVREQQIGQTVRCNDCHTLLTVTRPRQRRRSHPAVAPAPDEQLALASAPTAAEAARTSQGESAIRWLHDAERDEDEQEPPRPTLDKYSYLRQLFGFLLDLGTMFRMVGLSIGLAIVFLLLGRSIVLANEGGPVALLVIVLIVFQVCVVVPMTMYWANCGLAIVSETSDGNVMMDDWSEDSFIEWFVQAVYIAMAFLVSSVPAAAVAGALSVFTDSPWVGFTALIVSVALFFPLVLLSMLESGHMLQVYSPAIWNTLWSNRAAWVRHYLTSAVLGAALLAVLMIVAESPLLATGAAVLTIILSFIYFRSIGLAAFYAAGAPVPRRAARDIAPEAADGSS